MADVSPHVRRSMQGNRSRNTRPELALRSALHAKGLRYRVNQRVLGTKYSADIVFSRARVAVFVDGCWWHRCPEHYKEPKSNTEYWRPKIARNVARDRRVDALLKEAGWAVIRVWEHESVEDIIELVVDTVRARSASR